MKKFKEILNIQHKKSKQITSQNYEEAARYRHLEKQAFSELEEYVPFISEVEIFNTTFGKLNNSTPTTNIPGFEKKFIYDFILEELEEYKEAYEKDDIVGIADAFGDIMYVLSAGILVYGLKDKFEDIFQEIQASNMSKSCSTEEEAIETVKVRSQEKGYDCHYEKVDDKWIVYRSSDRKAQKSINYFSPNLKKFI